ncbi:endonuclease III [[Pseudopropionibacterium] massiliense]|uniref:endonuclease III n=1 Tax=[Pseudopropionibacterium] massiliense TaxID=2220000 RepID=UPI0010321BE4|nr:endonuclease III [[Pseudopropionibacterium] massiliense]
MTAAQIGARLAAAYPDAHCELEHRSPFELLVATVLSAQTTDVRVNQVTPALFARYPDAEHLAEAEQTDVEDLINSLGLYRSKAKSLIGLARALVLDHGGRVPESLDELVKLPGVGRKTANVVLGNAFGIPGITPDTHVIRVSNRLGWVHSTTPGDVERAVGRLFPPKDWVVLCHRIIWHGRRCCRARTPTCTVCPVEDLCPSSQA